MRNIPALCAVCALLVAMEARADTGFYVRGDLGIAIGTQSDESDTNPNAVNASLGTTTINGGTGNGFVGDIGIGFRATPLFRVEGTYTHIGPQQFKGSFVPGPGSAGSAGANIHSEVGLINGYFDAAPLLPSLPLGAQPFVTLGIGVTSNTTNTETDSGPTGFSNFFAGATNVDLAWAAGIGAGFPVADNIVIDITYRYLDLGERRTGTTLSFGPGFATTALTVDRADLQTHTITVGARLLF